MAYYETYLYAWIVYLAACVGFYWCVLKVSKYWENTDVRDYLRMFTAVILFTPASHEMDGIQAIAPAFMVFVAELLTYGFQESLQGLLPLLLALFLGATALAIHAYFKRSLPKKKQEKASE
ncbi:hypothetical protein HF888_11205 [Bermanella marisrubri]|uniref:Uncharacterized protein n=1 Tax=Bermanella marisrubri TaxID=207949 RepID=Q1N1A6_9GAMM|nr:hypothetical protein [Bermanella marisrubri]EAT11945.1 hypothetical protein RED65_11410 [Oceanobacter sp. RED65] [Bermanella marisrubri]QIZ84750.1 hypothetical protein HF888_11205 [Bermanella marisrubri]